MSGSEQITQFRGWMPKRGYWNTSRKIKFSLTYLAWRRSSSKTAPVIIRGRNLLVNHFQPSPLVTHHAPSNPPPNPAQNCRWPTFSITTGNKSSWFGLTHLKNAIIITIQTSDAENGSSSWTVVLVSELRISFLLSWAF